MAPRRVTHERLARLLVAVGIALPLISVGISRESSLGQEGEIIELHARVAEEGGWQPSDLTARVGSPITLRLTSDDVVHGFAIGQSEAPGVDVLPGQYSEATLTFDRPGRYTYYCTRWCGPGHWRMRGTIEVRGDQEPTPTQAEPLHVRLGLDLDVPHLAPVMPARRPSAAAGEALGVDLPAGLLGRSYYEAHSPAQAFESLRAQESLSALGDESIWDLVALLWRRNTTSPALEAGGELFAQNCAACHGEGGQGDGVMANTVPGRAGGAGTSAGSGPADFTNLQSMLGASPAILHGKILRGGMGTGMPYFGPIFTNAQIWSLADFLWTFTMEYER